MKMEDPGEDEFCRLCFEGRGDETVNPLISPCRCKGTQKYVHLLCLEKWQNLCLSSGSKDSRAFVCSVCRAEFSIKPRPLSFFASVGVIAQKIGSTSVNFLLVFFFSHIFVSQEGSLTIIALFAALAYSFLYCNFTMAFAVIVLRLLLSFVAPQLVSLRLIWQVGDGGQVGLAFVRYGASIQGLTTGTLLVASRQLEGSIFEKSVIFLHAHDQRYEIFIFLSSYRSTSFLLTFFARSSLLFQLILWRYFEQSNHKLQEQRFWSPHFRLPTRGLDKVCIALCGRTCGFALEPGHSR